jgi:hypothetical protein
MDNLITEGKSSIEVNLYYKDQNVGQRILSQEALETLSGSILKGCIEDCGNNNIIDYHLPLGVKLKDWDNFLDIEKRNIRNLGQALLACALSVETPEFGISKKQSIYVNSLEDTDHLEAIAHMNKDHPMYNYIYNDIYDWLIDECIKKIWEKYCCGGCWYDFDLLNRWIRLLKIIYMRPCTNQFLVELHNIESINDYKPTNEQEGAVIAVGSESILWDYKSKLSQDNIIDTPIELGTKVIFKSCHILKKIINEGKIYATLGKK